MFANQKKIFFRGSFLSCSSENKKMLKIFIDKKINPILPMVEFFKYKRNYLLRVCFSSRETDDTSKQKISDIAAKIKIKTLKTTLFKNIYN